MLCDDGGKEKENVGFLFYFTKTNELVNFVKNIFGLKLNFEMHGKNISFPFLFHIETPSRVDMCA